MEEIIRLEKVSKAYWDGEELLEVLKDVDLVIYKGEFVAIVAPSGSGKSTLLNIMGLLDPPTSGKVYLKGKDAYAMDDEELSLFRGKHIGFVFQSFNLIPELTALENVTLPMEIMGMDEKKARERGIELLRALGLEDRAHFFPAQLSGGQKQRVAIARALANKPDIIFADEPTGNLDPDSAKEVLRIFEDLHSQGHTLVLVTHDHSIARRAQRIYTIKDKRVVELESLD
ncbi:MAG: ABC transporter ATP-binding protein [Candidatus Micrarchaeota archaeon]|nr:ABC transporter ATP-binding protein [Candidatus Micrarchaeota archaeon]